MSDRRDFDDIKLVGSGLDIKDSDLRDFDVDLLAGPDLNADLLGDDFEEPVVRGRKRKSGSSGKLGLLVGVLILGGGGAFAYLNKDALMPLIMGDTPRVAKAPLTPMTPPVDTATTTPTPADAAMPDIAGGLPQPEPVPNVVPGDANAAATATPTPVPTSPSDLPVPPDANAALPPMPTADAIPGAPTTPTTPVVPDVATALPTPVPVAPATNVTPSTPVAQTPPVVPVDAAAKAPADAALKPAEEAKAAKVAKETTKTDKVAADAAAKVNDKKSTAPAAPEGKAIDAGDLGDIKMPELPDVENAMKGKDDFIESTTVLDDLSDATAPRMNLTTEQKSQGLGVSVTEKPKAATTPKPATTAKTAAKTTDKATAPTATVGTTTAPAGAVSGATAPDLPDIEAKIAAANRALDLERFQAAYDMFNDLYKMNPRDERILMGRAIALQKLGRNEEAVQAYDELLAINPDNPEVMINALALVRGSNPTEALSRLLTLRQKYPTNATIAAQIGLVNAELKNYDEGIRYLNIAADLESTNPKHFFNMAVIAERMGRPDMAIGYYERALKADALSANSSNKLNRDLVYDRLSYLRQQSSAAAPAAQ